MCLFCILLNLKLNAKSVNIGESIEIYEAKIKGTQKRQIFHIFKNFFNYDNLLVPNWLLLLFFIVNRAITCADCTVKFMYIRTHVPGALQKNPLLYFVIFHIKFLVIIYDSLWLRNLMNKPFHLLTAILNSYYSPCTIINILKSI